MEPFTRFEDLRSLIKELGYNKTKHWTFRKDVTDMLWVELDFGIRSWKRTGWPSLTGSLGDRKFARIIADTMPEGILATDRERCSCSANVLPLVPEIGRELFGEEWVYNYSFSDSTYSQLEHQTRMLDHYMVDNISDATIERLVWKNNSAVEAPVSIICHLLGHGRYDEAVKHYTTHRTVDTQRIGIRRWLIKNGLIEGPNDPWEEERKKSPL
jgi:hypothetical protein